MPNVTAPNAQTNAASQQALPASLKQALADPFTWADHPDVVWSPPMVLPPVDDISAGIRTLTAQLAHVDRKHAAYCLSKLLVGFNERKTADETRLMLEVWIEANGDVPNDLWSIATLELLRSHKFGMPKPVHMREAIASKLAERKTQLDRAYQLWNKAREAPAKKPVQSDPIDVRLRTMRDSFRRFGQVAKAAGYERKLAEIEGREAEAWALDVSDDAATAPKVEERPPFSPADTPMNRRLRELAAASRAGRPAPRPDPDAIPEAAA